MCAVRCRVYCTIVCIHALHSPLVELKLPSSLDYLVFLRFACFCSYVPLRAYKILRPTRIRFDKHWAVKTRCDVLRSLYSTAGERSSRQIGMLGDMFKTASQLEAPPATMVSSIQRCMHALNLTCSLYLVHWDCHFGLLLGMSN